MVARDGPDGEEGVRGQLFLWQLSNEIHIIIIVTKKQ
jgi:hypothetical protein